MRYLHSIPSFLVVFLFSACAVQPKAQLKNIPTGFSVLWEKDYPENLKEQSGLPTQTPPVHVISLKTTQSVSKQGSGISVFKISTINKKKYKWLSKEITLLSKVLKTEPNYEQLGKCYGEYNYPSFPYNNCAQAFHSKLTYFTTDWGKALGYITQFTQDGSGDANNEDLCYYVQGLSKDGKYYISGSFALSNPALDLPNKSKEIEKDPRNIYRGDQYILWEKFLNEQSDNSFNPPIEDIITTVKNLKIKG